MVELQLLSKILREQSDDIITKNNITDDYFEDYKEEWKFIKEHKEQGLGVVILRECVKEELNKYEEKYITQFKPKFNYKGVIVPYNWTSQDSWKKIKNGTKQQRYIASSGKTAELGCSN